MTTNTMQSYWMQMIGDQATLELRDVPQPVAGDNQVLVRLHAASLNRGEFIAGHGLHGKSGASKAIGMEGAGEVVALGNGVSRLKLGDRVMGRCAGAFSEYAVMDVREAMHKPASLTWEEAACIPLTFLVVYDMLVLQGRLVANEWLLINGVSSGVGVAALQMAKALGAKVIGTSGSADKLARIKPLGLDIGLHTRGADFYDAEDVRCMQFEGRHATVGYVDGTLKAEIDLESLHAKRLTFFGVSNKQRNPDQRAQSLPAFSADILPLFETGRIKPLVDHIFPFTQLAQAKAHMDANQHVGKIVLSMGR
jgi:NADPH:quinone reductase